MTLSVLPAILILALQCSCYPYSKDGGKGTVKSLIKADRKKQVLELRIETRSPEVSLLGIFPLPSSPLNLCLVLGQVVGNLGNMQIGFPFPEGNQAFQAHFAGAASLLRLPRSLQLSQDAAKSSNQTCAACGGDGRAQEQHFI